MKTIAKMNKEEILRTCIDLNKLEYGIDYYGLPINNIVFIKTKEEIIKKISENIRYSDTEIKNPNYIWSKN